MIRQLPVSSEALAGAMEVALHEAECGSDHPISAHEPFDEVEDSTPMIEVAERVLDILNARLGSHGFV